MMTLKKMKISISEDIHIACGKAVKRKTNNINSIYQRFLLLTRCYCRNDIEKTMDHLLINLILQLEHFSSKVYA